MNGISVANGGTTCTVYSSETDKTDDTPVTREELAEALQLLSKYVETPFDQKITLAVMISPVQQLRSAADELEQKIKDVTKARQILTRYTKQTKETK